MTARHLNAVIDAYPLLLQDGSELAAGRVRKCQPPLRDDRWLAETALALNWKPLKPGSVKNALSAVNHFLALAEMLAREELERTNVLGINHNGNFEGLIRAIQGKVPVAADEVFRMRQNSILGSVAKYASKGARRNRRLRGSTSESQEDTENKVFPLEYVSALIKAATSWRDKALRLLLATAGNGRPETAATRRCAP